MRFPEYLQSPRSLVDISPLVGRFQALIQFIMHSAWDSADSYIDYLVADFWQLIPTYVCEKPKCPIHKVYHILSQPLAHHICSCKLYFSQELSCNLYFVRSCVI